MKGLWDKDLLKTFAYGTLEAVQWSIILKPIRRIRKVFTWLKEKVNLNKMAILWQEVSALTIPGRIFFEALRHSTWQSRVMKRKENDKIKERYRPQGPKQEFWSLESSWRRERVPVLAERKFNKLIHTKIWYRDKQGIYTETSNIFQDRLRKY